MGRRGHRRADDDEVLEDQRGRARPEVRSVELDRLVETELHVDDAVLTEAADGPSRLRVEGDEVESRADDEDALVALAVGPVGDPTAGVLPWRRLASRTLVEAVGPQGLGGAGVDRDDIAAGARGEIQNPVHHQRRGLVLELGAGPEVVAPPPPCDLETLDVVSRDLVEAGISGRAGIAIVALPLAVRDPLLCRDQARGHEQQPTGHQTMTPS